MGSPISEEAAEEIARLMRLFSHPWRMRLATVLAVDGPASASMLSDRFDDLTTSDCSYHMGVLKQGGIFTIAESRPVRGAKEQIYRIEPRSRWPFKPRLHPLIAYLIPALTSPTEPFFVVLPLELDLHGVWDVRARLKAIPPRVDRIGAAAQRRLQGAPLASGTRAILTTGFLDAAEFGALVGGSDSEF